MSQKHASGSKPAGSDRSVGHDDRTTSAEVGDELAGTSKQAAADVDRIAALAQLHVEPLRHALPSAVSPSESVRAKRTWSAIPR